MKKLLLCSLALFTGCTSKELENVLKSADTYVRVADEAIFTSYQVRLDACQKDAACVDKVRKEYEEIAKASDELNKAICKANPDAENCK